MKRQLSVQKVLQQAVPPNICARIPLTAIVRLLDL